MGGSEVVKRACLDAIRNSFVIRDDAVSEEIAISVLIRGFPGDPDVAKCCADEISGKHRPGKTFPFIGLHDRNRAWIWIKENFKDHPLISDAIHSWAEDRQNRR